MLTIRNRSNVITLVEERYIGECTACKNIFVARAKDILKHSKALELTKDSTATPWVDCINCKTKTSVALHAFDSNDGKVLLDSLTPEELEKATHSENFVAHDVECLHNTA